MLSLHRQSATCLIVLLLLALVLPPEAVHQQGIRSGKGRSPMLGLPPVPMPVGNPMSAQARELGKLLFFDKRLSKDNTIACASCHMPDKAFSDGRVVAVGIGGRKGSRNVPSILNAGYNLSQFWDGRAKTLEEQALGPITNPLEMGARLEVVIARLAAIQEYRDRFKAAFGGSVSARNIAKAIANFERSLVSGASAFDRHSHAFELDALSEQARLGLEIFHHRGRCAFCHIGPTFTDNAFHNLGVGMDDKDPDLGRFVVTGRKRDRGAFKTPSLRNVSLTAPYMHDGSLRSLEEVVDFYDKGGIKNETQDARIFPRQFSKEEKEALLAFLRSLTGEYPRILPPKLPR